jgi:hypothetical protein
MTGNQSGVQNFREKSFIFNLKISFFISSNFLELAYQQKLMWIISLPWQQIGLDFATVTSDLIWEVTKQPELQPVNV